MEIINNNYELDSISYAVEKYFNEETLFFDIECTGLSPRKSFIYLIGYATRKGSTVTITQLLAKDESDELSLLQEFEKVMSRTAFKEVKDRVRFQAYEDIIKQYDIMCQMKAIEII